MASTKIIVFSMIYRFYTFELLVLSGVIILFAILLRYIYISCRAIVIENFWSSSKSKIYGTRF